MSFILEALRRADAQRESHPDRGLHAQALPVQGPPDQDPLLPSGRGRRLAAGALALGVLIVLAFAAWRALVPAQPLEPQAPVAAITAAVPATQILPPAPMPLAGDRALPVPPSQASPVSAAPADSASPRAATPAPAEAAGPRAAAASVSGAAPIAGALPPDAPALAVSGGVYAASPAQRLVIVNGQVHGEGAEPAAGVRVQEIRPGAVVLLYRGQRYLVAY